MVSASSNLGTDRRVWRISFSRGGGERIENDINLGRLSKNGIPRNECRDEVLLFKRLLSIATTSLSPSITRINLEFKFSRIQEDKTRRER